MLPGLSLQAIEESRVEITDENLSHDVTSTLRCYQNESVDALLGAVPQEDGDGLC
jgi:hypothetical protein